MNEGREVPRFEGVVTTGLNVGSGVKMREGVFVAISNLLSDVARGMDDGEIVRLDDGEKFVGVRGGLETGVLLCEKEKGLSSSLMSS